jgi:DNA-binding CsgD family transcriptional regulator
MDVSLEDFSRAVAAIHGASAGPECWPHALRAVASLLQASKGAVFDIDVESHSIVGLTTIGHDPSAQKAYVEHYFAIDPTMAAGMAMAPHEPATIYDAFPQRVRNCHEYFDFARSADIGDALAVGTRGIRGRRTLVSLQRPYDAAAFEPQGKRIMTLLASHFEIAKQVQTRFAEAISDRSVLVSGLDCLAAAAFILDSRGHIRHANVAANAALAADRRLHVVHGRLSLKSTKLNSCFEHALRIATGRSPRGTVLPLPSGTRHPGELTVLPLPPQHDLAAHWQAPLALVILGTPRRDADSIASRMRMLYGLTPAEARVVAALALGSSVEEVAQAHCVRESTVRAQIRSIFDKTSVGRQSELVRLALDGLPLVGAGDAL